MDEIEVKILEVDVQDVMRKLKKLGAKKTFDGEVVAQFFDFPDRSLKKRQEIVRLRTMGSKSFLTFKKKRSQKAVKIMDEREIEVKDPAVLRSILAGIGLCETLMLKKHRISYTRGKIHFEIDSHDGIPPFLEVEAKTRKEVERAVQLLGFSMMDAKPWTGGDVFRHYGRKRT